MGNQNNSVARKRLSTLAITTTLAAVGVGVVGTGAANAATPQAHTAGQAAATTAATVKVTPGTGATSLTAMADLTGTSVDPTNALAKITIDWNDGKGPQPVPVDAQGMPIKSMLDNVYTAPGTYNVVVKSDDGVGNATSVKTSTASVTVTDATLVAKLSATSAKKNSPVTLDLTGSSVDKSITKAKTTVDWGDETAVATFGDPGAIKPGDAKLTHSYAADNTYTVTVSLDDGLGTKTSVTTQTFTVKVSETGVVVDRASGNDRYGTGLAISSHQWATAGATGDTRTQAKAVVLATGNDFADALVGVPLAKKAQGPLLLTDGLQATTNPDVLKEIKRILPTSGTTIYILGGEKAMNAGIQTQLTKAGYNVKRLAGEDRFSTALQIAKVGMGDPSHIIVARGDEGLHNDGFADALAAGPYAANVWGGGNSAVVLSNFTTFDPNTAAYVTSKLHATGDHDVAAIGGQATAAMGTIRGSAGLFDFTYGQNRYETAAKVAKAYEPAGKTAPIGVATGLLYPDALTGGAYMATINGPLLLTDPKTLSDFTGAEIADVAKTAPSVTIFGGEKAVTPAVANAIAALVKVSSIGKF